MTQTTARRPLIRGDVGRDQPAAVPLLAVSIVVRPRVGPASLVRCSTVGLDVT